MKASLHALVDMVEEAIQTPEQDITKYTNVHFEAGDHEVGGSSLESAQWLNADEMLNRMQQYKPQYVFLDGLLLGGIINLDDERMKQLIRNVLPGTPQEINGTNTIRVVAGDFISENWNVKSIGPDAANQFSDKMHQSEELKRALSVVESMGGGYGIAATSYIALAWLRNQSKKNDRGEVGSRESGIKSIDPVKVTRRNFLRGGLAALGVIGATKLGVNVAPRSAAYVDDSQLSDFLLKLSSYAEGVILRTDEINARTANGYITLKESMMRQNENHNTPASVVFGYGHALGASKSESSPNKVIVRYLSEVDTVIQMLAKDYPNIVRKELLLEVGLIMARTEVYKIESNPTKPENKFSLDVQLVDSFFSNTVASIARNYVDKI